MKMTLNAFMQRLITLIACLCLAASGTSVALAQAGSLAGSVGGSGNGINLGFADDNGIRIFLAQADTGTLDFDITAPSINHLPSINEGVAGEVQTIVAEISDNQSVARAVLMYRNSTADVYSTTEMSADVTNTTWLATVDTTTEDTLVNYYIVAEDSDGNRVQKGSAGSPLTLTLQKNDAIAAIAPLSKDNTKWLAIGLGVLAVGALIAASAGGSGGGDDNDGIVNSDGDNTCCTITFTVPNVSTQ